MSLHRDLLAQEIAAAKGGASLSPEVYGEALGRLMGKTRVDWCADIDALLSAQKELVAALDCARVAIDDWLNTYASEMCNKARVKEAFNRIAEANGTLAYIALIQQSNRAILAKHGR